MIELGLNKPQGLDEAKKITAPTIMPKLQQLQTLVCSYDLFSCGEKKYVICLDDDDIRMMNRSYSTDSIDWYIFTWPTSLPEYLTKKVV